MRTSLPLNLFLCGVLLALPQLSVTQQDRSATPAAASMILKGSDLVADVATLREAYETMHPGLYRYNSREQMDRAFADLARQLDHDQSLQDAYLALSVFAARIRCGHTYANFFNQSEAVQKELFQAHGFLPFYFEWIAGEMVVTRDFTADRLLPRGTRVLSVDQVATKAIRLRKLG